MNQEAPLPTLWNAVVDQETLDELISDLQQHAVILGVQEKHSPTEHINEELLDSIQTIERFRQGVSRAIQIHYRFEEKNWCDTIIRHGQQYKIVRMEQPELPTG